MRLQLALNVRDMDEAVAYYSKLFGIEPHKRRPGYANFAIPMPPLKLVLFENPRATERLNHLGVEIIEPDEVPVQARRLGQAGILDVVTSESLCCHATQDKMWSHEPQGLRWEWYRITDDSPEEGPDERPEAGLAGCCTGESGLKDGEAAVCCG